LIQFSKEPFSSSFKITASIDIARKIRRINADIVHDVKSNSKEIKLFFNKKKGPIKRDSEH
jgi:hypothetical protein